MATLKSILVFGLLLGAAADDAVAQTRLPVQLSAAVAEAFDGAGPVGGVSVLPWSVSTGSRLQLRAGVDGWLGVTKVATHESLWRTMWGIGPALELSAPRGGATISGYAKVTGQLLRSSVPDILRVPSELPEPMPERTGITRSGVGYGGEVGLALDFRATRLRLGVGYLRHAIYEHYAGGLSRLVLSVEL